MSIMSQPTKAKNTVQSLLIGWSHSYHMDLTMTNTGSTMPQQEIVDSSRLSSNTYHQESLRHHL